MGTGEQSGGLFRAHDVVRSVYDAFFKERSKDAESRRIIYLFEIQGVAYILICCGFLNRHPFLLRRFLSHQIALL